LRTFAHFTAVKGEWFNSQQARITVINKDNRKKFGKLLKEKRTALALSQSDVAEKVGYSNGQFISNIERGLCPVPLKSLKKLITLYKIDASEVVELLTQDYQQFLKESLIKK